MPEDKAKVKSLLTTLQLKGKEELETKDFLYI